MKIFMEGSEFYTLIFREFSLKTTPCGK